MKLGILFLHGYTGGRYELLPLIEYLSERYDFMLEAPEYPGHGSLLLLKGTDEDMWFEKAKQSYELLSKKVDKIVIVGFSMGGIIAGLLAKIHPPDKLVLIAPAYENVNIKYLAKNPYRFINNMRYADVKILEMILLRTIRINFESFLSFKKLQQRALYIPEQIVSPTLIIHGTIDGLVPIEKSRQLVKRMKNAKLVEVDRGPHEICISKVNKTVFYEVEKFIFKNKKIF